MPDANLSDDNQTPNVSDAQPAGAAPSAQGDQTNPTPVDPKARDNKKKESQEENDDMKVGTQTVPSISDMAKPVNPPPAEPGTDSNVTPQAGAAGNVGPQQQAQQDPKPQDQTVQLQGPVSQTPSASTDQSASSPIGDDQQTGQAQPNLQQAGAAQSPNPSASQNMGSKDKQEASTPPVVKPPSMPSNVGGSMPPGGSPTEELTAKPTEDEKVEEGVDPSMKQQPGPAAEAQQPSQVQAATPATQPQVPASQQQPQSQPDQTADPSEELKKTHEPVIILPDRLEMGQVVEVKVKVGMIGHVMEEGHHIESIELFSNDQSLGKVDLKVGQNPVAEASFQVALAQGMQLKAVALCNIHGRWEAVRQI